MQSIIIKGVKVQSFRGFKGIKYFNFYQNKTLIVGENYQGKTSIAEAIVFGLCGTNLEGGVRGLDASLIHAGEKTAAVAVSFIGLDGKSHEVVRRLTPSTKIVTLDGKKAKASDIEKLVGPTDKFLSAFWPAGLGTMKTTDARKFFMGLVKTPTYEEVVESLDSTFVQYLEPHKDRLHKPADLLKDIRQEIKDAEQDTERCLGQLQTLFELQNQPLSEGCDPKQVEQLKQKLAQVDSQLDQLANVQAPQPTDTSQLEEKLVELRTSAKYYQQQARSLSYNFNPGDTCPTCRQQVSAAHVEGVKQHLAAQVQQLEASFHQVIAEGQNIKAVLEQMVADNERKMREFQQNTGNNYQALRGKRAELQSKLDALVAQNATREYQQKQKQEAAQKIEQVNAAIKDNDQAIIHNMKVQDAVAEYISKQAELITQQVQKHFKRVSIQLFEVTKTTGEIKPVFKLLYDGKPFNLLSTSEGIRLGLEVANFVKHATGIAFPTYLDNAESITHYDAPVGQLIEAKVVEGQELIVEVGVATAC